MKIIRVAAMSPEIVPLATLKVVNAGLAFLVASACLMARALPFAQSVSGAVVAVMMVMSQAAILICQ